MGKAFVAKLAKQGARDPEALAAWIGRKKHGGKAFAKLSAKGRRGGEGPSSSSSSRPSGVQADSPEQASARARKASAAAADHDAPKPTTRNGRPGYIGTGSPEFDAKTSAKLHRKAQREREKATTAHEAAGDREAARAMREAAEMHRIGALHADRIAGGTGTGDNSSGLAQVSSNVKTFDRMEDDRAKREAGRTALPSPEEQRAAGIASIAAANQRAADRARQETADRRARQAEAIERINASPGKAARKAMTKEERAMVSATVTAAVLDRGRYEALRPFADESAQTNRVDVLKSRAYHKAKAQRAKNGWQYWDAAPSPAPEPAPAAPRTVDPVAEARERNRSAAQEHGAEGTAASGFTAEEERTLEAAKAQTAKMDMGQLQAFEEAYRLGSSTRTGRTRADDLRHEAVRREIERRHDTVRRGMDEIRKLNRGAHQGSFMMGQRPEGVEGMRLRRMSDEKVNRSLQLTVAVSKAAEEYGTPMSREEQRLLYDVMSALRRENSRRNLTPVR